MGDDCVPKVVNTANFYRQIRNIKIGISQTRAQRLNFIGFETGVQVTWDRGWVWMSITMTDVGVGFRLMQEGAATTGASKRQASGATNGNIGSASFIDSTFRNV
ncbi:hypothetical protein PspLS_08454 [Pyricularia sp. CBS 133598]|nr:hypothetical protein PspLS_08454 [Pyricularia sp. CBS 133598]